MSRILSKSSMEPNQPPIQSSTVKKGTASSSAQPMMYVPPFGILKQPPKRRAVQQGQPMGYLKRQRLSGDDQKTIEGKDAEIRKIRREHRTENEKKDAEIRSLKEKIQALEGKEVEKDEAEVEETELDRKSIRGPRSRNPEALGAKRLEEDRLRWMSHVHELRKDYWILMEKCDGMEAECEMKNAAIKEELQDWEAERASMAAELLALRKRNDALEEEVKVKNGRIAELEKVEEEMKVKLQEAERRMDTPKNQINMNVADIASRVRELEVANRDFNASSQEKFSEWERVIEAAQKDSLKKDKEGEAMKKRIRELEKEGNDMKEKISELESSLDAFGKDILKIERLERQVEVKKKDIQSLQATNKKLEAKVRELEVANGNASAELLAEKDEEIAKLRDSNQKFANILVWEKQLHQIGFGHMLG